ncbi:2-oxoadipate dioxygenase/decarboxylase family protein [Actinoplanes sp. L3-i22]|uniref:2-oxoadipate dioxygenase/decarboxylase family protein n=1 Tax=Actinoplanes sp. L3-i22 TaxID=2836373 RepID=UPI001C74ABA9|nr:DUF1338 family protein [Actinoplanes sp. L3-i22]BCY11290.1 hypothetical protein L3i22_063780 [Actinoplanes sp. L3-i22]
MVPQWRLRARFAQELSTMYGREVPAYTTLVQVSEQVNTDVVRRDGRAAERLGSIGRITAERHGAIRVGTPAELGQVARIFGALGMHPVGFYDLRDAASSSVPVISTAFRPIDAGELARNPFRVFTSMLTPADPRFFTPELRKRLETFLAGRQLFGPELLELADRAEREGGLAEDDAENFLRRAVQAFELSPEPVDRAWYGELEKISAVAADIGGVRSTHVNHLTPRVLDIDELYRRMTGLGISMIDEIQGPPRWHGPDVLLRQTSFRALAEARTMREADGTIGTGALRVRFGEVEARGIALTPAGRARYDALLTEVDRRLAAADQRPATSDRRPPSSDGVRAEVAGQRPASSDGMRAEIAGRRLASSDGVRAEIAAPGSASPGGLRAEIAADVWAQGLPDTEAGLREADLAYFAYTVSPVRPSAATPPRSLAELVDQGWVTATPIVYEDFLPRSAAGIFQSNLSAEGTRDTTQAAVAYDQDWLAGAVGRDIHDPFTLYAQEQAASIAAVATQLGTVITQPGAGATQLGTAVTQPGAGATQLGTAVTQPGAGATQLGTAVTQPGAGATQLGTAVTQPGTPEVTR